MHLPCSVANFEFGAIKLCDSNFDHKAPNKKLTKNV